MVRAKTNYESLAEHAKNAENIMEVMWFSALSAPLREPSFRA